MTYGLPTGLGARFVELTGADRRGTPRPTSRPQVDLEHRRSVPVWLVRLLTAVLLLVAGVLVATGPVQLVIAAMVAVAMVLDRSGMAAAIGIAAVIVAYLARQSPEGWSGVSPPLLTAALLLCLHACAHLGRWVHELAARGRVEVSALAAGAGAGAGIQVFAQVVNLLIVPLSGGSVTATAIAVIMLACLAVVCWLVVRAILAEEG